MLLPPPHSGKKSTARTAVIIVGQGRTLLRSIVLVGTAGHAHGRVPPTPQMQRTTMMMMPALIVRYSNATQNLRYAICFFRDESISHESPGQNIIINALLSLFCVGLRGLLAEGDE